MRYEFSNDHHKTKHWVLALKGELTVQNVERLKRWLCGDSKCTCSGTGGVRGPQKWKLVDTPGGAAKIMRSHAA